MITGICPSSPSTKNPITVEPSTNPVGDEPTPDIAAEVTGCIGIDQGRDSVGNTFLSSV